MQSTNENNMKELDLTKIEKFAHEKGDALFGYIEQCHVESSSSGNDASSSSSSSKAVSFGNFLDAGTGSHSLRWIASILHRERLLATIAAKNKNDDGEGATTAAPLVSMESFTAITADENMRRRTSDEAESLGVLDRGNVIIGNWNSGVRADDKGGIEFTSSSSNNNNNNNANGKQQPSTKALLEGRTFDTILADYLVGAIDGFSPYFQDQIFHRLAPHLTPGGKMYVIGLQPIPDSVAGDANVFCKITKVRDACILLANHRCYREYPLDWIERHVQRAGLTVVETKKYPIRYDHATMVRQINVGRSKLKLFPSEGMAEEMGKVLDELEKESLEVTSRQESGRVTLGFDYVVVAEKPKDIITRMKSIL